MNKLPVIDVSILLNGNAPDKKYVGDMIRAALETSGFFYISNHNFDTESVIAQMKEFFDLPEGEKRKIAVLGCRGWSNLGSEITKGKKDWHECIDFMAEPNLENTNIFASKNQWPIYSEQFRTTMEKYITDAKRLGYVIMESISQSFGVPLLDGFNNDPFWIFRLLYYPVLPSELLTDDSIGLGVGEHTDYGCLTFVFADNAGLEIKYNDAWIPVEPIENHLICNIGDMLSFWSNGLLKSTIHRVIRVNTDRRSIAFFFEPNFNTIVKPLEQFQTDAQKIESIDNQIHYGTYLESKYRSSYPDIKN